MISLLPDLQRFIVRHLAIDNVGEDFLILLLAGRNFSRRRYTERQS